MSYFIPCEMLGGFIKFSHVGLDVKSHPGTTFPSWEGSYSEC